MTDQKVVLPKSRLILGVSVFIIGFLMPLLVPFVTRSTLPVVWKTTLSGLLLIGIPEVFMLITIAILGKDGYNYFKQKLFNLIKKHGPPDRVGKLRYTIGLVMFLTPILVGWLLPYFRAHFQINPDFDIYINVCGDALLFFSVFVLGGDFWDKIRALFFQDIVVSTKHKVV